MKFMTKAKKLRDAALNQVEQNANQEWKDAALEIIHELSRHKVGQSITSDVVWLILSFEHPNLKTHQPSAMGAIFRRAASLGYIHPSREFVQSERPSSHARPIRVWILK